MIRALLLSLALCLPVAAEGRAYARIEDLAGVLSLDDARVLDRALTALLRETGVEGVVVTMPRRGAERLETWATRLFSDWGVGDPGRNDGFMVLVLPQTREARIELGAGYPAAADETAAAIMNTVMLPAFRGNRLSDGMRDGTLAVIDRIARPHAAGAARGGGGGGLAGRLGFVAVVALMGMGLINRHRKSQRDRTCPRCGGTKVYRQHVPVPSPKPEIDRILGPVIWRRCPDCGWGESHRGPAGSGWHRGGGGGGPGGGHSSGGGASGRW